MGEQATWKRIDDFKDVFARAEEKRDKFTAAENATTPETASRVGGLAFGACFLVPCMIMSYIEGFEWGSYLGISSLCGLVGFLISSWCLSFSWLEWIKVKLACN